jgi:IclR family pca regulon transcriptional regulator
MASSSRSPAAAPVGAAEADDRGPALSQSLERGLMILSSFRHDRPVLGIAELSRMVGLNKSTTYRYVATLAKLDFLRQDPESKKYSLGYRVVDLGFAAINSLDITRVAGSSLQRLADETGCTASMAVLDGTDIVYVDRRRSGRAAGLGVDLDLRIGSRLPAYCTSMGKVLLAYQDRLRLREILDRTDLARRAPKTITAREDLLAQLAEVRNTGMAMNDEELAPGLRSLSTPVRDQSGGVVAAINLAVQLTVWNVSIDALAARLEGPLRAASDEISTRLGYRR